MGAMMFDLDCLKQLAGIDETVRDGRAEGACPLDGFEVSGEVADAVAAMSEPAATLCRGAGETVWHAAVSDGRSSVEFDLPCIDGQDTLDGMWQALDLLGELNPFFDGDGVEFAFTNFGNRRYAVASYVVA